jgi:class 3 adenylate cyclase/tetratricopeptide (TPR) repeat protein
MNAFPTGRLASPAVGVSLVCSNCGTDNAPGRKFCGECGTALARICSNCGAANEPNVKFCGECGTPFENAATPAAAPPVAESDLTPAGPLSERRLVSVLFVDLVGFTPFSEGRDPEEVREVLSHYFDIARQLVDRYGGTIEKFIGDAVMAVWGTPVAQEDDAERAVRAALDLTQAVTLLGSEIGASELRARAGVLTGEAAVTVGIEAEGMIAGDMVNTASRIQSAAPPGTVLVGGGTRRATEAAVVYEDAGMHDLKGKAEPLQLWRAVRIIGGRGGALRSEGLEAPFVGRARELRMVKELMHQSAESRSAHLVSVVGIGGIGKSRLSWELFKYIDGLQDTIYWHRGRCLSYGEGVTYWALAEMVRGRAGIMEGEESTSALGKLREAVELHISDPEEREWVEPRLAHLLGLEDRTSQEPEDLFSAWRVFFERMSETYPVVLVFEDMQWADPSLLSFLDYLLNWSRNHALFVLALARPEFIERHPQWTAGGRGVTVMHLEPLSTGEMKEVLAGLVPGLPERVESQILDRAQGVPLYAVETVRMLLDRGLLVANATKTAYEFAGSVEDLEVPETLHALIAARLDGLPQEERRLVQDAAVLGKTFSVAGVVAVTERPESEIAPLLSSLVRKEILTVQADPRSPERGQYGFLQDLVRKVAYDTLSKKERKLRHLLAAVHLEASWAEEDEIAEVVASHYLEAYRATPDAEDAPAIKARARDALTQAGARAASLAAGSKALEYYEQAIELTDDPAAQAELHERAGRMAFADSQDDRANEHYERALATFEVLGRTHDAARVVSRVGEVAFAKGLLKEAALRMESAFEVLVAEGPSEDLAILAAELARVLMFQGRGDVAMDRIELALELAELFHLRETFVWALNTRAIILMGRNRREEAVALVRHALQVSLDEDLRVPALRSYNNLGAFLDGADRIEEELQVAHDGLELARKTGDRRWENKLQAGSVTSLFLLGRWDEAMALGRVMTDAEDIPDLQTIVIELMPLPMIDAFRGNFEEAHSFLDRFSSMETSDDVQNRGSYRATRATILNAEGEHAEALALAEAAIAEGREIGMDNIVFKWGMGQALEGAFGLGNIDGVRDHLATIDDLRPGEATPYVLAEGARFGAKLAAAVGRGEAADREFAEAERRFREIGMPFSLATTMAEHAEWLSEQGRAEEAEPLLAEARGIFTDLKAAPWVERLDSTREQLVPAAGQEA